MIDWAAKSYHLGDRLIRIEAIVESKSQLLQAMLEQRATNRLEHEDRMRRLQEN